ncbi:regulator of chromosome condensation 1/beta-lactamase-inhibitor protein II [Ampelomyces quisqualis]|uniref:Regulator of chromosome condensation 1/beta-lactamase-inhibitor protein II n=1 Tax=Ampelomyces quisqualis TaxID=50730 RepID=A0A6A5R180_AMPQU|nr:regulator of chromosome condensation 1/beta-lactamase-inhibitor protein II [Ampelomyces quisqualis]
MAHHLYVFGSNGEGQLGIPAADIVDTPTLVSTIDSLETLSSVHGGDNHTLLFTVRGEVYGVGDNRKAQLIPGAGEASCLDTFKLLKSGLSFTAAACESSAYVTTHEPSTQSTVRAQGQGLWGELGYGEDITSIGTDGDLSAALQITLPGRVIDFAAGVWHYVAILDDGSVYGWGKGRVGQLGEQLSGKVGQPTKLENIPFKPQRVVCGLDFTYLVGHPSTGEHIILGKDKNKIISSMPHNIHGWKDIGATWQAIFVLLDNGKLIAWGRNQMWELIPPALPLIDKIAVGSEHILAVTQDGKLISWGWGKHGNCGNLANLKDKINMDMVSGLWNEIELPGKVEFIGAGACTSFVVTRA